MPNNINVDPYLPENINLFHTLYGENLISLGGLDAVDNLFSGISLDGKTALDIGFGLGGVAYYLAAQHNMKISGVEVKQWMADYANQHAATQISDRVAFNVYDTDGNIPFAHNHFDIAYSKGVLNHVKDKVTLFKKIHTHLKKDGLLVIADWIHPHNNSKHTPLNNALIDETESSYRAALSQSGFTQVDFRNDNVLFANYVHEFLNNLATQRKYIQQTFGTDVFDAITHDHQQLINHINNRKIATRIIAKR